ncbi:MAG: hypothetical protein KY433_05295 [Actinobacteria bacterium]|nr:hypothetical protein [Actinomycetota bacterium]
MAEEFRFFLRSALYALVAGVVVSFTAFTLAAALLLGALGLPDDLLRNVALVVVLGPVRVRVVGIAVGVTAGVVLVDHAVAVVVDPVVAAGVVRHVFAGVARM